MKTIGTEKGASASVPRLREQSLEPLAALSLKQPWAWALFHGKDVENREWYTPFRGRVWIHASKGMTKKYYEEARAFCAKLGVEVPPMKELLRGGIIGSVEIYDCVQESESPWFFGKYGFLVRNAVECPFRECKGTLGFFDPENPVWRGNPKGEKEDSLF